MHAVRPVGVFRIRLRSVSALEKHPSSLDFTGSEPSKYFRYLAARATVVKTSAALDPNVIVSQHGQIIMSCADCHLSRPGADASP